MLKVGGGVVVPPKGCFMLSMWAWVMRCECNIDQECGCCAGEIMMQLLTLNTQPIDDGMRKSILDFADAGKHIMPSSKLSWPKTTAETFEAVAIACMRAGDAEDTAKALNEGIVPALQSMRGETLQSMWKQSGASAKQRADGSFIVPSAYRCATPPTSPTTCRFQHV